MGIFGSRPSPTPKPSSGGAPASQPGYTIGKAKPQASNKKMMRVRVSGSWVTDPKTGLQYPDPDAGVVIENEFGAVRKERGNKASPEWEISHAQFAMLSKYYILEIVREDV